MVQQYKIDTFSISIWSKNQQDHFDWCFTGVYDPNGEGRRKVFFEELVAACAQWKGARFLGGDFNVARGPSRCSGVQRRNAQMELCLDFISAQSLIDPHLNGATFTWSNKQEDPLMSRLDRFMFSSCWEDQYDMVRQLAIPNMTSDHCPILLNYEEYKHGPSPFRFEFMWLEVEGFKAQIAD